MAEFTGRWQIFLWGALNQGRRVRQWIVGSSQWGYRFHMKCRLTQTLLFMFIVLFGLSACHSSGPYVFKEGEFNRNSPTFNKVPDDIDKVQICYSTDSTTPDVLRGMAKDECGRYGKRPLFQRQDLLRCPLVTPVMATFSCVRP